ncbi:MAG: alpha amylase C-terminal domain-containing protein, partial [Lachnospiraceae bacterium]|nr:alpha amylase C-terminal domain-containing protein [Lachnospiraceae bacterium]
YLDYGRRDGEWVPNRYGNNKNLEAIEFFKHLNSIIKTEFPGCMMIAEESTAWPQVTRPPYMGGLGFDFKWNMGWMHDFCAYMKLDPILRKGAHYNLTFAMSYNEAENYILPISHDEVVHLKCSMLNKMPGFYVDKFANLRVGYTYMFTHCGKKLLFMGQDFGQDCEWSEERELEWHYLADKEHGSLQNYMKQLLSIYNTYPALYENDNNWESFEWINADDKDNSIYTYIRKASNGKNNMLIVLNMTPMERKSYRVGVPKKKKYKLLLNSDELQYGGTGMKVAKEYSARPEDCAGWENSILVDLAPYAAHIYIY